MEEVGGAFDVFFTVGGSHIANKITFAGGGHNGGGDVGRFETRFFVVTDGVADVVHHDPAHEVGAGVFGDEVVFGAGAPENAGVDAEHGDDAVAFLGVVFKDGGFGGNEFLGEEFLDFFWVFDFVEEEGAVGLDDEGHFGGLFGGGFDNFLLQANREFFESGLHEVGFADHHGVDEPFDAFGVF